MTNRPDDGLPSPYGGRGRALLVRLMAIGVAQAAVTVASALLVREGFRDLTHHAGAGGAGRTLPIAGALALAALVAGALRGYERVAAERLGQEYAYRVRSELLAHAQRASPRALGERASGAMLLRFVGDVTSLRQWASLGLARLVVLGTATAVTLAALAVLDAPMALAVAAALGAGGAVVVARGGALRATTVEVRRRRSRLAGLLGERLRTPAVVQAYGQGDRERRRARLRSRRLRDAMVDRARVSGQIQGASVATGGLAHAAALLAGALEVRAGNATPGTLVAALLVAGVLAGRLPELGRVQELRQAALVGREKARRFLAIPVLPSPARGAPRLAAGPGCLELRDIAVEGVLEAVSAVAAPGRIVAVTGANGAGKSTLLAVVAGLVAPDRGAVLLDGQPLAERQRASVRRAIGLVSPDLPLLRGTIAENVGYRWRDAPAEELCRVAALCGLDELYAALPDGPATRVGEGGHGLSAGQRQRIALARALLGNPRVLLLDEADVHLDIGGGALVRRILAAHEGCALVVTHRPESLAAHAEWHLERGRLHALRRVPRLQVERAAHAGRAGGVAQEAEAEQLLGGLEHRVVGEMGG